MTVDHIALLGPASPRDLAPLLTGADATLAERLPGYRGVPTSDLATALLNAGVAVDVVTTAPELDEPLSLEGPRLRMLVVPQRRRARERALDLFKVERRAMVQQLRSSDAPILHAMWTYEFALAAQADSRPAVVTAHDAPLTVLRHMRDVYRASRAVLAYAVRFGTRNLTAVSPYLAQRWRREMLYRRPIAVVPNMIFQHALPTTRREPNSVLCISDGSRRKNVATLIEAFARLRLRRPQAVLDLIGPGLGADGELARWARACRRAESVRFRGVIDRGDVVRALAKCALLVHPSREESFGLTVAEAMASGAPVVASCSAGAVPWVLGGGGLLVDVEQPQELCMAIESVLSDRSLAEEFGRRGKERVEKNFSPAAAVGGYLSVYERVVRKNGDRV